MGEVSDEPEFLAQCGEHTTPELRRAWIEEQAGKAKEMGMKLCRCSIHPTISDLTLFEAWRNPRANQGEQRWGQTNG